MEEAIGRFFNECCMEERGATCRFTKLWDVFSGWWEENGHGPIPSRKALADRATVRYLKIKIAGAVVFRELRLRSSVSG